MESAPLRSGSPFFGLKKGNRDITFTLDSQLQKSTYVPKKVQRFIGSAQCEHNIYTHTIVDIQLTKIT